MSLFFENFEDVGDYSLR